MPPLNLYEVVKNEHRKYVSELKYHCSQDVKIICSDGEIWCSKILLYLMEPSLKTLLLEEGNSDCVILHLSKYVRDFLYFFDFNDESAKQNIELSSLDTDISNVSAEVKVSTNSKQCSDMFSCEMCGILYGSLKQLKSHMWSKHKKGEEKFQCSECEKQFIHQYELNKHKFKHIEASFMCEFCEQKFKRRAALVRHYEQIHKQTSRPLLKCPECDATFSQQYHLTRHLSSHTNVKFNCTLCNTNYSRLDSLNRHIKRKHSSE